jgi:hypothetical protein
MTRRDVFRVLAVIALAGCSSTSQAKVPGEITVELSSVTLGDDCAPVTPPASKPAPAQPAKIAKTSPATPASPSVVAPGDAAARCAGPSCGRHCDQTSMQLAIQTQPGTKPTTLKVKRVELLDDKGKLLEVLTAREPTQWAKDGKYVAWDQTLGGNQHVQASYALTAPSWNKLTNGRWNAHSKTFQLRVTVTVGTGDRTVEKQSITAARLPPAVPT